VAWFRKRKAPEQPLVGARPRVKTYAAESGYVYQYTFAGQRALAGADPGTQYVFDIGGGAVQSFRVSVLVRDAATKPWRKAHSRELVAGEKYAIAKIAMQRYLDTRNPDAGYAEITPQPGDVESILDELGA
jgi:hypothetical protein